MWAVMIVTFAVNVYAIKILPVIQLVGGIMHVTFFVALVVPLVLLARRSTPEFVFDTVLKNGGYKSDGVSWCIGLLTVTYCFLGTCLITSLFRPITNQPTSGFDAAVHMSEEVRNPSMVIPKILIQTIIINGALAFGFVFVLLFCIGNVSSALNTNTGFPVIEIFYQATGSKSAATVMMASITTIGLASNIGVVASVSRLTWAFARDGGLPYSEFFAHVDSKHHVPYRAIGLVSTTVVLLSLINVGSSTALSAILALTTFSLYLSYLIPIILILIKRFNRSDPNPIKFGPWTLGKLGAWVNIYAIVFGILVCIFAPFPPIVPVTAVNMNYSGPVFGALMVFLILDWVIRGRKKYEGPLKELLEATQREERRREERRAEERWDARGEESRRNSRRSSQRGFYK
jgi:choline transport protein